MAERVPRLVPGVDFRKLKLDPTDGFVLSRVDGKLLLQDLARETGLPDFSVARTLEKLEKLGVIVLVDPAAPPPPPPAPAAEPPKKAPVPEFKSGLAGPKYDPKELESPADLPPETKKRILDLFYRLDDLDHYTLLGVTKEADKKGVKRAYFELAALFHPDRYFKKDLGIFKQKMEILFTRITEAHDTLINPEKRAEYDAYIAEVATTRGMEAMLERALIEARRASEEMKAVTPPAAAPAPPPPAGPSPEELQRRKEALARRLTGGRPIPGQPSTPPPEKRPPQPYSNPTDAMDALKRRYETRIESATAAHAAKYAQAGEDALAKKDWVAASTAFTLAAKYSPDDAALAQRAQEVKVEADTALCDSYLKQAKYEEHAKHWAEASRSWVKVAKIKNDAGSHERAANAILHAPDGDLHEAAEHAKLALGLEPSNVANHITLIEIYAKAGLSASARRAAESATALDPKHAGLQALVKRIGKA
jgi:curved DNA-binding protein CbpA